MAKGFPFVAPRYVCEAIYVALSGVRRGEGEGEGIEGDSKDEEDTTDRKGRKKSGGRGIRKVDKLGRKRFRFEYRYYSRLVTLHPACRMDPNIVTDWCLASLEAKTTPSPARLFQSVPIQRLPGGTRPPPPLPIAPAGSPLAESLDSEEQKHAQESAQRFGLIREDMVGGLLYRMIRGWQPVPYYVNTTKNKPSLHGHSSATSASSLWAKQTVQVIRSVLVQPQVFAVNVERLGKSLLKHGFFEGVVLLCLNVSSKSPGPSDPFGHCRHDCMAGKASELIATGIFLAASAGDSPALKSLLYRAVRSDKRLWTYTLRLLYVVDRSSFFSTLSLPLRTTPVTLAGTLIELARLQGASVAIKILRDSLGTSSDIDQVMADGIEAEAEANSRAQSSISAVATRPRQSSSSRAQSAAPMYKQLLEIECLRRGQLRIARELAVRIDQEDQGEFREIFDLIDRLRDSRLMVDSEGYYQEGEGGTFASTKHSSSARNILVSSERGASGRLRDMSRDPFFYAT